MAFAGCNRSLDSIVSSPNTADSAETLVLMPDTLSRETHQIATASSVAYGTKVERILNATKSNYDYLITFYLPYNPGNATFQGHAPWGWQSYAGSSAWVYDARPTSLGFRVIVRTTFSVVWWCSTAPGNYRLIF